VRTASKLDVLRRSHSAESECDDVVELEECGLGAPALAAFERTSTLVARPDGVSLGAIREPFNGLASKER
jgi:hypothetical protein